MDIAMKNKIVKNSLRAKDSKMHKNTIILKKSVMNCLVAMIFLVSIAGCNTMGKKEAKPDRFGE